MEADLGLTKTQRN